MNKTRYTPILHTAAILGAIVLSGCAVGPDFRPPVEAAVTIISPEQALFTSDRIQRDWWRQLQDPQLDRLVNLSLERNHDIRIAHSRLLESRAVLDEKTLDQFPTVTANAGYHRSMSQANPGPVGQRNLVQNFHASIDANWEIDLFGRLRRTAEASAARSNAAEADLAQARIVVVAEVARNYYEMRGAERHLELAQANLEIRQATLRVTESMASAGRAQASDLASARAELASTKALIPQFETSRRLALYHLAILAALRPNELGELAQQSKLPILDTHLPIGDLSSLLRRRPDVASAESSWAAATAEVGAATAELYPRIDLGAFLGFVAMRGVDLGSSSSRAFGVTPLISWPALHLASVRARQRAFQASEQTAQARYEQTVLRALEEVEAALTTYGQTQQRVRDLAQAADQSQQAASLLHTQYREGRASYLSELDAQRTLLRIQDGLADAETASYISLIVLYKALGGGWEPPAAPADS
ncbi:efflux transporter outer membrane subunit [Cupriavidus sp. 2MCAB6]|uniref:efflux transporter outer membrane subunit n=1 Tax=Cupriavidus sp. 2MCAB6 TaxID=3232981 RepID=UPI003F9304D5